MCGCVWCWGRAGEMGALAEAESVVKDVKPNAMLEMLAQKAVKHLDETPCMHFVSKGGVHERRKVPKVVVEVPEVCKQLVKFLFLLWLLSGVAHVCEKWARFISQC